MRLQSSAKRNILLLFYSSLAKFNTLGLQARNMTTWVSREAEKGFKGGWRMLARAEPVGEEVLDTFLLAEDHRADPARVVAVALHLCWREGDEDGPRGGDPAWCVRNCAVPELGMGRRGRWHGFQWGRARR